MSRLTVTTAPTAEPVDRDTLVKPFLGIDTGDTSQDAVLDVIIASVRQAVENHTNLALITQTLSWEVDSADLSSPIDLPRAPLQSITSFTTYDEDGAADPSGGVSSDDYYTADSSKIVSQNDGWEWQRKEKAATIVFVAGYGDAATDVPARLRHAVLREVARHYRFRELAPDAFDPDTLAILNEYARLRA